MMQPVRPRYAPFWPRRVLLVGGDSVVSRALLVFLRKEGFDAAIVSEDPAAWGAELNGRPFSTTRDHSADAVIVSPHVTGERRAKLRRALRQSAGLSHAPVVALRDAGDDECEGVDASVAWPFRLREVLGTIDSLTGRQPRAESA
jgi:DNA-binding response OmpR family regulator